MVARVRVVSQAVRRSRQGARVPERFVPAAATRRSTPLQMVAQAVRRSRMGARKPARFLSQPPAAFYGQLPKIRVVTKELFQKRTIIRRQAHGAALGHGTGQDFSVMYPPTAVLTLTGLDAVIYSANTIIAPLAVLTLGGLDVPTVMYPECGILTLGGLIPSIGESVTGPTPAGRSRRGARRRAYVEIDGEQFWVDSAEEAVELFRQAKEAAALRMPKLIRPAKVKRVLEKREPIVVPPVPEIKVVAPEADFLAVLQEQAKDARAEIDKEYERYFAAIERLRDEEDVETLLLLG